MTHAEKKVSVPPIASLEVALNVVEHLGLSQLEWQVRYCDLLVDSNRRQWLLEDPLALSETGLRYEVGENSFVCQS
jgi:hypothetical protein